ncbi:MAG TPA: FkbM family methyltransferase [Pyrinomonadaceae bacterium]|jgi:FkbM family methyltransferase|nr:FkbM family methyltransferase [Pyrinomonadaceae bacterium]
MTEVRVLHMKNISLPLTLSLLQPFDFPHKLGMCERLYGRTLMSSGICWVKTGAGISWKLDLSDPCHRWIVYGKYEGSQFINWARNFLKPESIVIDSGANIGQILIYLVKELSQGRVLAFEPGREQADWLEECLRVHPGLPVELIRAGLGASPGQLYLRKAGYEYNHGSQDQISESEGEPVEVVRLADELARRSIETVDLWKLDVEGYEVSSLQGAEDLLKEKRVKALYVELAGDNGQRVREYLDALGYACYLFDRKGKLYSPNGLPDFTNGLFLPG